VEDVPEEVVRKFGQAVAAAGHRLPRHVVQRAAIAIGTMSMGFFYHLRDVDWILP
jgi:hypothetical protein